MRELRPIMSLAAALAFSACAGAGGSLPSKSVLRGYQGRNISELEARMGKAENSVPDGRGGRIYLWSESRGDYDFEEASSQGSGISSNPRDGTMPGTYSSSRDEETAGEYTVETEVQVWADAQGRIYDFKRESHRSR